MRNSRNSFCTSKCAKNSLFWVLLIFAHSCCAKINGARKLMGLRCNLCLNYLFKIVFILIPVAFGTKYSRMDQVKFVELNLSVNNLRGYALLKQIIPFKFFKGFHPQISVGLFLNTLSHLFCNKLTNKTW